MWKTGSLGGWAAHVGTLMDLASWKDPVIAVNDAVLKAAYGVAKIEGFRAPRLEVNENGLNALVDLGYRYDVNMEEGHQWNYVAAAVADGADTEGFDWVVWPYTLDNGSPGVWQSQDFGEKAYLNNYPRGMWESPVYMPYIPDNGLQEKLAERMKKEITSEPTDWIGDKIREVTAFDFNTFLYARMTKSEWVEVMKYNFKLRYNGNRAPMTFGAHPAEFSARYDKEVILLQTGNEDFHDVLDYNTFQDRKDAMREFVLWVQSEYADDAYMISNGELIDYMEAPWDKDRNPVPADELAAPRCSKLFTLLGDWVVNKDDVGSDAQVTVVDKNTMDVDFTIGKSDDAAAKYTFVDAATYFQKGAFAGVSHIDIVYETGAPFRVRLLPEESDTSTLSMQALVAGVGGERVVRIRVKDFRPDPYADPVAIAKASFVDSDYLGKVAGLSFESASTKDEVSFTLKIKQIIVHGLADDDVIPFEAQPSSPVRKREQHGRPGRRPLGSGAYWTGHPESR